MNQDSKESGLLTVKVGTLAYGGGFVANITDSDDPRFGKKVFIREVAPDELVEAVVVKDEKRFIEASLLRVIESSSERVDPLCPLFGTCGGCDLQHLNIAAQRSSKLKMVSDTLRFQAGAVPLTPPRFAGIDLPDYYYRRRISLHIDEAGQVGFYRSGTAEVVDTNRCYIASEPLNEALLRVRSIAAGIKHAFSAVTIEEQDGGIFLVFKTRESRSQNQPSVFKEAKNITGVFPDFKIMKNDRKVAEYRGGSLVTADRSTSIAGHFSQVNRAANAVLIDTVVGCVDSGEIDDLYAGSGNLSLPLAAKGITVNAVEMDKVLVAHGREIAARDKLSGSITFHQESCEGYVKNKPLSPLVVLDPPRSGARNLIEFIAGKKVEKIIYVSCNLPSLCRDIKDLAGRGYVLSSVCLIDMFPQTHHVETVSVLVRQ